MISKLFDRLTDYFIADPDEATTSDKGWFYGFYIVALSAVIITFSIILF